VPEVRDLRWRIMAELYRALRDEFEADRQDAAEWAVYRLWDNNDLYRVDEYGAWDIDGPIMHRLIDAIVKKMKVSVSFVGLLDDFTDDELLERFGSLLEEGVQ